MKFHRAIQVRDVLLIALLGAVAFLPFLGAAPLFDWDEINFAESAREMMVTGNYFQVQVNFEPFWEKPPLFIWVQVLCMKVLGVTAYAARLPNALIGITTLIALYIIGTRLRHTGFGWLLAAFYFVSFLPHLYFKSGIIDPSFNLLIFLGIYQIFHYELAHAEGRGRSERRRPMWAGICLGLATLTKGPVAVLVALLVYGIYKLIWSRKSFPWAGIGIFLGVYLGVILSWFGSIILLTDDGLETVRKFIVYQVELFLQPVAGHEQPPFYHLVIFIVGCFPLSAFAFRGMAMRFPDAREQLVKRMMVVFFWVVLVLFTIVRTKIVHYSSLLYFPGAFLAAFYVYDLIRRKAAMKWDNWLVYGIGFVVFGVGSMLVGVLAANIEWLQARATNSFAKANLAAEVAWTGWEFVPGLVFLLACCGAFYLLYRRRYVAALLVHLAVMPIYANGTNLLILPRIADYTQNAAIRFFESVAEQDAYLMVEGYKSYAHYFYGRIKPFPHPEIALEDRGDWMARRGIDKPVYLVTRVDRLSTEFTDYWFVKFKRIGESAGFVFFRRDPEPTPLSATP